MPHSKLEGLAQARLEDLKDAARKLSIEILFADLSDPEIPIQSGACKVRGETWIVVDQRLPAQRQVEVILNIFQQFDWDTVYVASWIRERIDNPTLTGFSS